MSLASSRTFVIGRPWFARGVFAVLSQVKLQTALQAAAHAPKAFFPVLEYKALLFMLGLVITICLLTQCELGMELHMHSMITAHVCA